MWVSLSFNMQTHGGFSAFPVSFLLCEIIPNVWGSVCILMSVCACVCACVCVLVCVWVGVCVPGYVWTPQISQMYHAHKFIICQMSKNHMHSLTNGVISWVFVWKFWICFSCIKKGLRNRYPICIWTFAVTNICNIRAERIPLLPVSSLLSHVSSAGSALWNQNTSSVQILAINKSSVRDKCHISPCLSQRV